jgi:hypothetical protein
MLFFGLYSPVPCLVFAITASSLSTSPCCHGVTHPHCLRLWQRLSETLPVKKQGKLYEGNVLLQIIGAQTGIPGADDGLCPVRYL